MRAKRIHPPARLDRQVDGLPSNLPGGGHFDYNALLGRLSSFAAAAEWLLREPATQRGRR